MGLPTKRVILTKLVRQFFLKLKPKLPDVTTAELRMNNSWEKYGYGNEKCLPDVIEYHKAVANSEKALEEFKTDMKYYPGKVLNLMKPPVNKYWRKGRHGLDQNLIHSKIIIDMSALRKKTKMKI